MLVGARIARELTITGAMNGEIYLRADNLFDIWREPQAGLPEPGRRLAVGVSAGF